MAGDRTGRKTLGRTSSQRSRLSNITNLVNASGWSNENELVKSIYNTSDLQLQQEIKKLEQINAEKDLVIAEKDQEIESHKLFTHKMQRDFYTNICKRAQQNEEIIAFNTRLSKELNNVREQLKMLHHEYTQMALVYKINESELQTRLAETQDQLKRVYEEKEKASYDLVNPDENQSNATRRTRSARRHSMIGDICNLSTNTHITSFFDTTTVTTRCGPRQRVGTQPQKDSSIKLKVRQHDCASIPIIEPYFSGPVAACSTKRYNNRYGHLNNLETMQELTEESEPHTSCSTSSRRSQGNPSLQPLFREVTERETIDQSSSNDEQVGEVASTSESNVAGVTKSSEPRLAIRAHKNLSDKNPPPARPNTPQRRAASQPSTPRKRSEVHMTSQKKPASQPSTPRIASPVRHADAVPASRSFISRAQASSPFRHMEPDQTHPQPSSRMSIGGRPSRRAAETVISYKEPSLVSKMRRPH